MQRVGRKFWECVDSYRVPKLTHYFIELLRLSGVCPCCINPIFLYSLPPPTTVGSSYLQLASNIRARKILFHEPKSILPSTHHVFPTQLKPLTAEDRGLSLWQAWCSLECVGYRQAVWIQILPLPSYQRLSLHDLGHILSIPTTHLRSASAEWVLS